MNTHLARVVPVLLTITALFFFPGCERHERSAPDSRIAFEHIGFYYGNMFLEEDLPSIHVLTNRDSPLPPGWQGGPWLESVDFSKYYVIIARYGFSGSTNGAITVTDIWQDASIVTVRALFLLYPGAAFAEITAPAHIIKVRRDAMKRLGETKFRLIDDYEKERAILTTSL